MRFLVLPLIAPLLVLSGCSEVPVTGRRQLSLVSGQEMQALSLKEYDAFLKSNKVSRDAAATAQVRRVGIRIQKAVEAYFQERGMASRLAGYQWEFNLVEDPQVNAWCMPGGKVVVYTGLLPVAQNDDGLAVVMGHEIAHAIAEHGAERMSTALVAQAGGTALSVALQEKPNETRALWMSVYAVGAQYGAMLPYSRLHEKEADRMGLIFMAMAGYDPNQAVTFWQRMAATKSGSVPVFMSTHPSDAQRIDNLRANLPEALSFRRPAPVSR
ncbi:MAG: M48 family metallopeptidase [Firmicutes bacterium]|nr:M48 family metallopeptidase [Bacillota bacterium]